MREKGKDFSSDSSEKDGIHAKTPDVISLLRNGTQIDVEPASFLSFPAFEKHVALAFSLGSEVRTLTNPRKLKHFSDRV